MPASSMSNTTKRTIAVIGSTGFVGRHLVHELVARGHNVRALARDYQKAARTLPTQFVSVILGDVFDAESMDELTRGADVVVNLIGIRRELPGGVTFQRMHVEATQAAIDAATRNGAMHFLHMSALGARPEAPARYHQTKWEAEQLVRDSGLTWTIFRPSVIFGPDGEFVQMAKGWVRGELSPRRFLPYFTRPVPTVGERVPEMCDRSALLQPVSVRDVAHAFAIAIEPDRNAAGEIIPLVGDKAYSWPRLLTMIRDMTPGANRKLKPCGVPAKQASLAATALQRIGLGAVLPFGPSEPLMAAEDNTGSTVKMQELLGVQPEPIESVLRWCVAG